MLDSEKALEMLDREHPILVFLDNGNVTDILIPGDATPRELEDRSYIQIDTSNDWTEEEASELSTIATDDAGYVSIPFSPLFNPYEVKYDDTW